MSTISADLSSQIHRHGYRLTAQRQIIWEAVREAGRHTTLDEVYRRVQKRSSAISLTTVYRTLNFLCELHLLVAIHIGRQTYYEAAGDRPHHHMICRRCGSVEVLPDEELRPLISRVRSKHDFLIDMDHLGLFGLCASCARTLNAS